MKYWRVKELLDHNMATVADQQNTIYKLVDLVDISCTPAGLDYT